MAKKKLQNYTWLIIAAIVVIAIIVMTSGGEGGALAKYYAAAKVMPVPGPTVASQGILCPLEVDGTCVYGSKIVKLINVGTADAVVVAVDAYKKL